MTKIRFKCIKNSKIKFKIKDIIQMSLSGLEAFLDNISKNYPDLLEIVINNLTSHFEKIKD